MQKDSQTSFLQTHTAAYLSFAECFYKKHQLPQTNESSHL